jgi:hypothetical protein
MSNIRRFKDASEATKEINDQFNDWSSGLSSHSLQAIYAIIAANWAVHRNASDILNNGAAKWSLIIGIGFLGLNILLDSWLTWRLSKRNRYISKNLNRWEYEFGKAKNIVGDWPFTTFMKKLFTALHILRFVAPFTAAGLFIASLF